MSAYLTKRGFTLIELLIVIAIISILSVVGIVLFTGIQKEARDSKRRADIDAIAKAYEVKNSSGSYVALSDSDFSSGKKPQDLSRGDYFNWLASDGSGFKACASLDANPNTVCNTPATNCYCKVSTQGSLNPSSSVNQGGSTNYTYGLGGSSPSSCDPNGTLLSGLVGYWKMDEGSGTSISDYSGYSNTGTLTVGGGGTQTTVSQAWSNGSIGKFNTSLNFDSYDDLVRINSSAGDELNPPFSVSVSAWIFISGSKSNNYIIAKGWGDSYDLLLNSSNQLIFRIVNTPSSDSASVTSAISIAAGGWHHVIGIYDQQSIQVYIDGTQRGTVNYNKSINIGSMAVAIGGITHMQSGNFGNGFNGKIDDARIYNRALSPSEISKLYNGCID